MKKVLYLSFMLLIIVGTMSAQTITNIVTLTDGRLRVDVVNNISSTLRCRLILFERKTGTTDRIYRAQKFNYPFALPNNFSYFIDVLNTGFVEFSVEVWIDPLAGPSTYYSIGNYYEIFIQQGLAPPSSDQ